MTELLTAAQMRAIEQAAIASGEVTGLELMERAGRGVVEAMLEWRPELAKAPHRAVVLCGPGNNGGDGFVVARLLKERGWQVEVFLFGRDPSEIDKLPPDAAENAQRWREMGDIRSLTSIEPSESWDFIEGTIVIDALFGTGASRPLSDKVVQAFRHVVHGGRSVVAIDLPSGVCSDSGRLIGEWPEHELLGGWRDVDLVVTFNWKKLGHLIGDGPIISCGHCVPRIPAVKVVDIGLGNGRWKPWESTLKQPAPEEWPVEEVTRRLVDGLEIGKFYPGSAHKYHHGHAMILSGGPGKGGAARLAARGALRIGAGLVTVGCPPAALQENAARLDAVMLAPVKGAEELRDEMAARKINAVGMGPGFGVGERLRGFVAEVLTGGRTAHTTRNDARVPVLLDADALTAFRDDPETLFEMLHEGCVLTPHEGEFRRLFPDILEKLKAPATKGPAYSKVDATREAAKRAGCVVLFKGADTVIADPDGRCAINSAHYERAAPWLATAGSGDVLTGFITGLLARGFAPMDAAEAAAWLHVECALKFGPGLIAEDLPEQLPAVFRDLGL